MIDKIICGDSIELIKSIDNEYVHAIISDIPYGICYEDWDILHNNSNSALGGTSSAQLEMGSLFKRRGKPLNGWRESDKKYRKIGGTIADNVINNEVGAWNEEAIKNII